MTVKHFLVAAALCLTAFSLDAQTKAPDNWFLLDPAKDNFSGTGSEAALQALKAKGKKGQTIIVAVLDSGVDYQHEDLKDVMWVNPGEIAGNGIDDDKNGYVDDIHGWNFIGGKDGRNVDKDNLELAREYARLKKMYGEATTAPSGVSKKDWAYWQDVKTTLEEKRAALKADEEQLNKRFDEIAAAFALVQKTLGKTDFTREDLATIKTDGNKALADAVATTQKVMDKGLTPANFEEKKKEASQHFADDLYITYNPDYNPRSIVGDNYADLSNRYYGNNDYQGPDASHGTHVAGIIAAARGNNVGINGVADNVRIMTVRCVPDGDERDKDVANAIRYAVDNGASIINMSFGKGYSPNKSLVDEAVRYAAAHDVLMVHAAGNSAENNDVTPNFPNDQYASRGLFKPRNASNWLEIGALSWKPGDRRVAGFSNYGRKNVDLFSPGVAIYSTVPGNGYASFQGTSMASPAAAGVAAILRSYYPGLSARQVKMIMEKSVVPQAGEVIKPGTTEMISFAELCASGGIVSAANAVALAEKTKAKPAKNARWRAAGMGKSGGNGKTVLP